VNAIENALWDLAGQAYGVPIYQMLGGKFRDKIRMYSEGDPKSNSIADIAADYKERVASGFTMLKMDLGVAPILRGKRGTMFAPSDYNGEPGEGPENYYQGLELSDKGCELVADYVASIKEAMGDAADVPMGHDHFGHLTAKSCIKLANALERVTPSTLEDMVPWFRVEEWKLITNSIGVPTLTGEDAYLVESLEALCQARAVDYIHPDHLVIGGCLELKKTSDMAAKYSVGMMVHSNATPIGYAAGVHAIAACQNFLAMEWHMPQPAWHKDLTDLGDLVVKGYIPVPTGPGLGIKVNEEAMRHLCRQGEFFTDPTNEAAQESAGDFQIHEDLADLLAATGHEGEAAAQYTRVLELKPNHPQAQLGLGITLLEQHRPDEARQHLEAAAQGPDAETARRANALLAQHLR
jgi:L-alanine-DL-glutamate epimerase-like enolase superfamily enzyme